MHLHRTKNRLPAFQPVEVWWLSSFPAHDLEPKWYAKTRAQPSNDTRCSYSDLPSPRFPEIRSLALLFAAHIRVHARATA